MANNAGRDPGKSLPTRRQVLVHGALSGNPAGSGPGVDRA
jgi:hypothetical protein